jgi:hypothetical protein
MYFLKNVLEFNHFGPKSKYQNMEQRYRCSSILPEFRGTTSVKKSYGSSSLKLGMLNGLMLLKRKKRKIDIQLAKCQY